MPLYPGGSASISNAWPQYMQLGLFQNNTAHSISRHGLYISDTFIPSAIPGTPIANYSQAD